MRAQIPSLEQHLERIDALSFLLDLPPNRLRARTRPRQSDTADAGACADWRPLPIGPASPRHQAGGSAIARGDRRYRRGGRLLLPFRQRRCGPDTVDLNNLWKGSSLQYNLVPPHAADFRGRQVEVHAGVERGAAAEALYRLSQDGPAGLARRGQRAGRLWRRNASGKLLMVTAAPLTPPQRRGNHHNK